MDIPTMPISPRDEHQRIALPPPDIERTPEDELAAGFTLAIHEFINRQAREQLAWSPGRKAA